MDLHSVILSRVYHYISNYIPKYIVNIPLYVPYWIVKSNLTPIVCSILIFLHHIL